VTMAAEEALVFFGVFAAYLLLFLQDEQVAGAATGVNGARRRAVAAAQPAPPLAARGSARPRH
jgi:hypothetical protein